MRPFLAVFGAAVVLLVLLFGLFSYLVLPGLIEARLAARLQADYGLDEEPEVEVSSSFPPELLLGRVDGIQVRVERFVSEGVELRDLLISIAAVDVSVGSLLGGDLESEVGPGFLVGEVPEASINEYLEEGDLGLEGGSIDVCPQGVVYGTEDAIFGLPASVGLDLRVAGPSTIEVIPQEARIAGIELPPFLTSSLASGGRTLELSELPLGMELKSVEPATDDALVVRAER